MADGDLFIALRQSKVAEDGGDMTLALSDFEPGRVFHIGAQYFQPYRPTLHEMVVEEVMASGLLKLKDPVGPHWEFGPIRPSHARITTDF